MTARTEPQYTTRFIGPRPFRHDEHQAFRARDTEISQVADGWRRHRVTLLHGGAGTGKTSLLQAGVLPRLGAAALPVGRLDRAPVVPVAAFPGLDPWTFGLLCSWYPFESPARVAALSMAEVIRHRSAGTTPILAAIDQADFVFGTSGRSKDHRARLAEGLARAMAEIPELHLLLSIRDEHLGAARLFAGSLSRDIVEIGLAPLDPAGARQVIGDPPADQIIDDLRMIRRPWSQERRTTSAVDPTMLQVACARLWADDQFDAELSAEQLTYEIDRALADYCAEALAAVAADHQTRSRELLGGMRAAFAEPGAAGEPEMPGEVLAALEDWHLLRCRRTPVGPRWELSHPRLIRVLHFRDSLMGDADTRDPQTLFRQAESALAAGDLELADRRIGTAIHSRDLRFKAEAKCFLGNLAYHRGDTRSAAGHYDAAAQLYEALQDTPAVGRLLTALGRLNLNIDAAAAVGELRAAADRLPNDPLVQTGLGQALWQSGQTQAALTVLSGVLTRDGDIAEALRSRGEMLADLGDAESALDDLSRVDHEARPATHAAWALAQAMRRNSAGSDTLQLRDNSENGPELLRIARLRDLLGHREDASELAERAVQATKPPLPPQLRANADQLIRLSTE